jgi:hypothetical protein
MPIPFDWCRMDYDATTILANPRLLVGALASARWIIQRLCRIGAREVGEYGQYAIHSGHDHRLKSAIRESNIHHFTSNEVGNSVRRRTPFL